MKKIEILLFVYNGERFLEKQINSILTQTYKNFTLHLIDDCSNDNSFEIINKYKNLTNVKIYRNDKNIGIVKNVEKYLNLINGEFFALSDQDDIWLPNKLEKQIKYINNKKPMLVHSDLVMINEYEKILYSSYFKFRNYNLPNKKSLNTIISQNGVMGNTILFNQKLKELILPFPKDLIVHDYWIALINEIYGERITLNEKLVMYRIHNNNLSNNISSLSKRNKIKLNNIQLPYYNINREKVLEFLLNNYYIKEQDKIIIKKFIEYLEFKKNKLYIIFNLLKYNFLKKSLFYRIKIIIKILLKKKTNEYKK
ncbi:glycosyltransferase family 2 protein [Caminibacter mediatlanticus TB-2]|uniref:Glycosyltransferase family 2 protein n=1 Tax=Caminibacter mediatlanticus TB-2 TaxID=391592 RepID=A0ABX5V9R2_9BACT|nr:glycosyltransferase family 2 protein [Caminibacter mediatlanticus]QCT94714.1 glycosyltransferase family 2 protein [Caminibacter mediatlanticus TB-2]